MAYAEIKAHTGKTNNRNKRHIGKDEGAKLIIIFTTTVTEIP